MTGLVITFVLVVIVNALVAKFGAEKDGEELFVPEQRQAPQPQRVRRRPPPVPSNAVAEVVDAVSAPAASSSALEAAMHQDIMVRKPRRRRGRYGAHAMRKAIVVREILNRPRAYDI